MSNQNDFNYLKDLDRIKITQNEDNTSKFEIVFIFINEKNGLLKNKKYKMTVEFDNTKTCNCCNVKSVSINTKTFNRVKKIKNSYYNSKIIKDVLTGEEFEVKQYYYQPSFFDIFSNWEIDEINRLDLTAYREMWHSRPNSSKMQSLKTTAFVNILFELFPKMMLHQLAYDQPYIYENDPIYSEITKLFRIDFLNQYAQIHNEKFKSFKN